MLQQCFFWKLLMVGPSTGSPALSQPARCRLRPLRQWQNQPIPYQFSGRGKFSLTVCLLFYFYSVNQNVVKTFKYVHIKKLIHLKNWLEELICHIYDNLFVLYIYKWILIYKCCVCVIRTAEETEEYQRVTTNVGKGLAVIQEELHRMRMATKAQVDSIAIQKEVGS